MCSPALQISAPASKIRQPAEKTWITKHQAFITGTILKTGRSRQGAKWIHSCTSSVHFASCSGGRKRICGQPVDDPERKRKPERTRGHGTILSRRGFQAFMARTGRKKDRQALASAFHRF